MARFVKGDVVVVPFPFSDLSQAKRLKKSKGIDGAQDTKLTPSLCRR